MWRKVMKSSLQLDERRLINGVLTFANMPHVSSVAKVERLFRSYMNPLMRDREDRKECDRLERLRQELCVWLRCIDDWRPHAVFEDIAERMYRRDFSVRMELVEERRGEFKLVDRFEVSGGAVEAVESACLRAVALILARDLVSRVRLCGWCKKFFVAFEGRSRKYCNKEHQQEFDATDAKRRQKLLRDKRRKQREIEKERQEAEATAARRVRRKSVET
jgi:hypothetical protein